MTNKRAPLVLGLALLLAAGASACAGPVSTDGADPPSSAPAASTPASEDSAPSLMEPPPEVTLDERFPVGPDGLNLAIRCWGRGTPVIVMDAGTADGGIARWAGSSITRGLAKRTEVCAIDRAGLGSSDAAPKRRRTIDEVVDLNHELLQAAGLRAPYLMVGSSGGGNDAYHHAGRYPDDVAGLVMLDVPAALAKWPKESRAELRWDAAWNVEHVDYLHTERMQARDPLPIPAMPVTVVTARSGQSSSDLDSQKVWLAGSSHPEQVLLDGGHDIQADDPEGVLAAVIRTWQRAGGR